MPISPWRASSAIMPTSSWGSVTRSGNSTTRNSAKRSLESELASAQWQRDQLAFQRASTPGRLPRADVEQGPTPAETQLAKLQSDLNRLRLVFTDRHPDVISLTKLIEQAQRELGQERNQRGTQGTVPNPLVVQLDEQIRGLELRIADLQPAHRPRDGGRQDAVA